MSALKKAKKEEKKLQRQQERAPEAGDAAGSTATRARPLRADAGVLCGGPADRHLPNAIGPAAVLPPGIPPGAKGRVPLKAPIQ